ncbi:MAG: DUF5681 domain-containing protein [Alphaproteobacteria bacterium]
MAKVAKSDPGDKQAKIKPSQGDRIAPYRWKKGQSGNPKGRPKEKTLTERLRDRLDADDGKLADAIVAVLIREAAKGKFPFAKEIIDRIDGRSIERREISGPDGDAIRVAADDVRSRLLYQLDEAEDEEDEEPS